MPNHPKKQKHTVRKNKNRSRKTKLQRGGVSNACVLDSAMHGGITHCSSNTNLHNVNPQASLDLDNKFMAYGGNVPLGANILQGGANRCGNEGVGTGNGKNETFKQYLDGLDKQLGSPMKGGANQLPPALQPAEANVVNQPPELQPAAANVVNQPPELQPAAANVVNQPPALQPAEANVVNQMPDIPIQMPDIPNKMPEQFIHEISPAPSDNNFNGGGFSTDPSEFIAGQPVYKAYDDCCPPAIVGGQLKFGAPDQPVCGLGAVKGGGRKKKQSKKSKKSKNRKTGKKHSRMQRGGDWNSVGRSKPAMYSNAFNGPASVFAYPDDMMKRTFDETQPNYSPNAI